MKYLALIALLCTGLVIGCSGKSDPKDPMPPKPDKPVVHDARVPYLLNCTVDLTPRLAVLKQYLDVDYEGLVSLETGGRAAVYSFKFPWYYPPQSNIQDRHGNQDFMWQNCPTNFSRIGLESYGDKICDLGWNRDWNRNHQAFKVCLDRGK